MDMKPGPTKRQAQLHRHEAQGDRAHFWAFFHSLPMPMKVLNPRGHLLHVNPALCGFLGYTQDELTGRSIFDFIHSHDVDHARDVYDRLVCSDVDDDEEHPHFEHYVVMDRRYLHKDGYHVWGNLYLLALWHPDGSLNHVIGLIVDITERKNALKSLEARELAERVILDTMVDGLITFDEQGVIETFNRACESIFGYTSQQVVGKPVQTLLPELTAQPFEQLFSNVYRRHKFQAKSKRGETIPVELSIGKMILGSTPKYSAIVRDLSEHQFFMERIRRSERLEAIGQLAGGISHDFNNVLTIINAHALLLLDPSVSEDARQAYIHKIISAAERGSRLTSQLVYLSNSRITPTALLNLNDVIHELHNLLDSVLQSNITLITNLAPDLYPVKADLVQLEQVLLNLVINARDAMPEGGQITIETCNTVLSDREIKSAHHSGLKPGCYTTIVVADTGCGIPKVVRQKIFDPFFTTKNQGSGLGLATVYNIVEKHGGAIALNTTVGEGSRFVVYLPAHPSTQKNKTPA